MAYEYGGPPPDLSKLIRDPETHLRYLVTQGGERLRQHKFAEGFQAFWEAILIYRELNDVPPESRTGQMFEEFEEWYEGPSSETVWVGPPGAQRGPAYWNRYQWQMHKVGRIWMDDRLRQEEQRRGGQPPLRLVCGRVAYLDLEAAEQIVAGEPVKLCAGFNGWLVICGEQVRDAAGNMVSSALTCQRDCIHEACPHRIWINQRLLLQRLPVAEWRRIWNVTRKELVRITAKFTALVATVYGRGAEALGAYEYDLEGGFAAGGEPGGEPGEEGGEPEEPEKGPEEGQGGEAEEDEFGIRAARHPPGLAEAEPGEGGEAGEAAEGAEDGKHGEDEAQGG